jgi:L-alanine-DL-glutamate epimerase-like enolase superfamily enzyme
VTIVEYMPWHEALWRDPPRIADGRLRPPAAPGLGLELDADAVAQFRVI